MAKGNKDVHYVDPSRNTTVPQESEQDLTAEYVSNLEPIKKQQQKRKRNWLILLALVVVAGLAVGAYFLFFKPKPAKAPSQTTQNTSSQTEQPMQVPTETYNSDTLGLTFAYPNTWKVDDSQPGQLVVTSTIGKLQDDSGAQTDGRIVITFLSGADEVPGYTVAEPVATIESQKLTYASPSQNQRKQTYVSFVNFSRTDGIEEIFITGDSGYKKGQTVPQVDVKKVDPIVRVVFERCEAETCGGETPGTLTVAVSEWQKNASLVQAENLLKSLRVQ